VSFFSQIKEDIKTNSEIFMQKLKKLKTKALFKDDKESLADIEWYILMSYRMLQAINDENSQPTINSIKHSKDNNPEMRDALEYLVEYSAAQMNFEKEKDMLKINKSIEPKSKTLNCFKKDISSTKNEERYIFNLYRNSIKLGIEPSLVIVVTELLKQVDRFDFNIFELNELVEKKSLHYILYEIFDRYNYFENMLDERKYKNFIFKIIDGYNRSVSYHNDLHAADVLQTTFIMIEKGNLINKLSLSNSDVLGTLLAAACHDFKHNGFNNNYHMNFRSKIATRYNGII
jgi:hypothetical protein